MAEFRNEIGLKRDQLAKKAGICPTSISHIENGDIYPSMNYLVYLIREYDLNVNWLLLGEEGMYISSKRNRFIAELANYPAFAELVEIPLARNILLMKMEELKVIFAEIIKKRYPDKLEPPK